MSRLPRLDASGCELDAIVIQEDSLVPPEIVAPVKSGAMVVVQDPLALSEFATALIHGPDFYDVSNVDGSNLLVSIAAEGANGDCKTLSCTANIIAACLTELQVKGSDGSVIACMSACAAFDQPWYCCTGNFSTPKKYPPTSYTPDFSRISALVLIGL